MIVVNPYAVAGPPPPAASGWNPSDIVESTSGVMVLSGSDKIVTHTGGASRYGTVRGTQAHSSGNWYFEFEVTLAHSTTAGISVGVSDLGDTLLSTWDSMAADSILLAVGNAVISGPAFSYFSSGISFNTTSLRVGVAFRIGTDFKITTDGSTFTTPVAFTAAGNYAPACNLGWSYAGAQSGQDGSIKLITDAASFNLAIPATYSAWG